MATAGHLTSVAVSSDDSTYYSVEGLDSFSTSLQRNLLEDTEFGDTAHSFFVGLKDGTASLSGHFSEQTNGVGTIRAAAAAGTAVWVQVEWDGSTGFNFKVLVSDYSCDVQHDGRVDWSCSLQFIAAHDTTMASVSAGSASSAPYAGYAGALKISGTSTAMTGEAMTNTTGNVYQVTDTARQVLDPDVAVTVYDGATPITASTYTVDYLHGKVTLGSAPGGAVTIDANYLPMWTVSTAQGASISVTTDLHDTTVMDSTKGYHESIAGLRSATVELTALEHGLTDYDTGGTSLTIDDLYANGTRVVAEAVLGSSGVKYRQFCLASDVSVDSAPDGVVSDSITFTATETATTDNTSSKQAFSFSDD